MLSNRLHAGASLQPGGVPPDDADRSAKGDDMRTYQWLGAVAAAVLALSLPSAAAAIEPAKSKAELITKCIAQAKADLASAGRSLRLARFDRVMLGTSGDDVVDAADLDPGQVLYCGFGGSDQITSREPLRGGDVFVGGAGDDSVLAQVGGLFIGGPGDDSVALLKGGEFLGGADADHVDEIDGGVFRGLDGVDEVADLSSGTFRGGTGGDIVGVMRGGAYYGGAGADQVMSTIWTGLFDGGDGPDRVDFVEPDARFEGGPGRDRVAGVIGVFVGGRGDDTACWIGPKGRFSAGDGVDTVGGAATGAMARRIERIQKCR